MAASAHDPLRVPPQFWQRDEVTAALERRDIGGLFQLLRRYCGASQTRIGTAVGMTQSAVSLIANRDKTVVAIAVLERVADGLAMPDLARMRLGLAPKEVEIVRRRTALGLGLVGALSPSALTGVLHESAAEALEFTRERAVTAVGKGTLEHLETVVAELSRSYDSQPAAELFPVARAYRLKVEQLINGRHTLKEARELYLRAANLSDLLSDLSHDLGSRPAAAAYAIDAYRHADQAGDDEACAWACSALACWSVYARRPEKVIAAAERGIAKAPRSSPIAAHMHTRAARGHAMLGSSTACDDMLAEAAKLCDQLPDQSPARFRTESSAHSACFVAMGAAHSHNLLGNHQAAEREARAALPIESWLPAEADLARLQLAVALANLGSPDEAVEHGNQAIASPRYLGIVRSLARELDTALTRRYPTHPSVADFHDRYQQLASRAITN